MGDDEQHDDRPRGYDGAHRRAERLASDSEETERLLTRAMSKAQRVRNVGRVKGFWSDLTTLLRLVRARISGRYTELPWRALVSAITGIVYFVNPLDVLPDVIPFLGYVDDAAVLAFVLRMIAGDLARFRAWEAAGGEPADEGSPPLPEGSE